jgi:hypothetical protein
MCVCDEESYTYDSVYKVVQYHDVTGYSTSDCKKCTHTQRE